MSKIEGFMIRIDADKHRQLKELSDSLGLKMVDLGRIAIDGLLDYANAHGGKLTLPLDFTTAWTQLRATLEETEAIEQKLSMVAEEPATYKTSGSITDPAAQADVEQNNNGGEANTAT